MATVRNWTARAAALLAPAVVAFAGCLGPTPIPAIVPMPPWVAERMEEKYAHPNDHRTPVLPPVRDGFPPPTCEDPPSEQEVIRAMPHMTRGIPFIYEEFRDDMEIISERLVDKIDPPRFFPLIGPAQLHHCHWKCTIYYKETVQSSYPFPTQIKKNRVQVVYIDKDHLHLYVGPNPKLQESVSRDLAGY